METLTALFGSETKIKILRLFLFNVGTPFFLKEIASRTQSLPRQVSKELRVLEKAEILIKKRQISKDIQTMGRADKITTRKVQGIGYVLNAKFPYLDPLKNLLDLRRGALTPPASPPRHRAPRG